MVRASFSRQQSGDGITYSITPIPITMTRMMMGSTLIILQSIVIFFLSLLFGAAIGFGIFGSGFITVVIAGGCTAFFVRWMFRRRSRLFGSRKPNTVVIRSESIKVGDESPVPVSTIRRIRPGNTFDENLEPQSSVVVTHGNASAVIGRDLQNAANARTVPICFSLCLDHGNSSTLIADGLDELTMNNILDDLAKDLGMA